MDRRLTGYSPQGHKVIGHSSSVQSLSHVRLFATPWIVARQAPCPSPTPGVYLNLCPSSPWCHPAISSSVVPFSSCPQSLPASGSFPTSQFFAIKTFFFFYVKKRASPIPLSFYPNFSFLTELITHKVYFSHQHVTLKYSLRLHFLLLYPISLANSTVRTILHLDCKQPKSKRHKSSCPFRDQFLWVIPEKGLYITAPLKHNDLQMPPSLKGNIFNWRK